MANKKGCARVNINLPSELLEKVDAYATMMNVNRTSAICFLLSNQFRQDEAMQVIKEAISLSALKEDTANK